MYFEMFGQSLCIINMMDMPKVFEALANASTKAGATVVASYYGSMGACMGRNTSASCAAAKYLLDIGAAPTSAGNSSNSTGAMMPVVKSSAPPPATAASATPNTTSISAATNATASTSGTRSGANAAGSLARLGQPAVLAVALAAAMLLY
jgi:hypothetical protein